MDFFEDVFVPEYSLQQPSAYDTALKQWDWQVEGEELAMSIGDQVRLRVVDVKFHNIETPAQLRLKGLQLCSIVNP